MAVVVAVVGGIYLYLSRRGLLVSLSRRETGGQRTGEEREERGEGGRKEEKKRG